MSLLLLFKDDQLDLVLYMNHSVHRFYVVFTSLRKINMLFHVNPNRHIYKFQLFVNQLNFLFCLIYIYLCYGPFSLSVSVNATRYRYRSVDFALTMTLSVNGPLRFTHY